MSFDFYTLKNLAIPEGNVVKITKDELVLWKANVQTDFTITLQKSLSNVASIWLSAMGRVPEEETGVQENYACHLFDIQGNLLEKNITPYGYFTNGPIPTTISTETTNQGRLIRVAITYDRRYANAESDLLISHDGVGQGAIADGVKYYTFELKNNTTIRFEWNLSGIAGAGGKSWWNCYITTQ